MRCLLILMSSMQCAKTQREGSLTTSSQQCSPRTALRIVSTLINILFLQLMAFLTKEMATRPMGSQGLLKWPRKQSSTTSLPIQVTISRTFTMTQVAPTILLRTIQSRTSNTSEHNSNNNNHADLPQLSWITNLPTPMVMTLMFSRISPFMIHLLSRMR